MSRRLALVGLALISTATACGGGVQEGSVSEFCADWTAVERRFSEFDPTSSDDLGTLADGLRDIRYPASIHDEAGRAVETLEEMRDRLAGIDLESDEASRIADTADTDAINALGDYANSSCDG